MQSASRGLVVLAFLLWTSLFSAQTPPAEPEAARAGTRDPGGLGPGTMVPRLIKFSGTFLDSSGKPMTGVHGLTVAVYREQQGGAPLWIETQNAEFDAQGRYSILLGATKSGGVPLELFATDEPRWLGVPMQLPGWEEAPRVLLVSVPYSLKAAEAETLSGLPLSSFVLTPEAAKKAGLGSTNTGLAVATTLPFAAVSGTGLTNKLPKWQDLIGTLVDSSITDTGSGVGIGTTNPLSPVHIQVSGTFDPVVKIQGANSTDGLALKLTHPNAALGLAIAGGLGHFLPTAVQHDGIIFGQSGRNMLFGAGAERMRISAAGNVGIGTTTPTEKLEVNGSVKTTALKFADATTQTTAATLTGVTAGTGLSGGGVLGNIPLAVDTTVIQSRVTGTCAASQAIRVVGSSGTVTCEPVGDVTGVIAGTGLTGGALAGTATLAVAPATLIRGITYLAGCDSCGALTDADDQRMIYLNVVGPMTINSVTCFSDAGTPSINLQRDDGAPANILTSNLSCSTTGVTSSSIAGSESVLNLNDKIDFVMVSAGGTAKRVTVAIKATVN